MKFSRSLIGAAAIALLAASASAQSAELTGTLKKIKEAGVITIGVRDSSIPFSYLDDQQHYIGYSVELCDKIASAVQKAIGAIDLKFKYQPVTSATRIPLMANGTIDLECGSTTNNLERQKQVAFAPTTFVTANRILSKKSAHIKTLDDLKGKTVVSTAGTSNIKQLTALNGDRSLGMNILSAKDHAEAFLMVETDRATAFVMDDILLASLAANSKAPTDYEVSKDALSVEPYGIMMRKDDPAFKAVADAAITRLFQSGDINKIYSKWFLSAIPPKNITLNIAMSDQLKAVIAKPTDSGDPAAYAVVPEAQKTTMNKKK